jgi:pimeloyl-ACP methyl ester carboxylesterase
VRHPSTRSFIVSIPSKLLFLPGASGNTAFWLPVAALLKHRATHVHLGWPGFGDTPADARIRGMDDLVSLALAEVDQPTAVIGQSMGGVVAAMVALARPELVTHLILSVTSGGIDTASLGAQDWRPEFLAANPALPRWLTDFKTDLAPVLCALSVPTLLLWGDADPLSPVAVGRRLATLIPRSDLHIIETGMHDLAHRHADRVAPLIDAHIAAI